MVDEKKLEEPRKRKYECKVCLVGTIEKEFPGSHVPASGKATMYSCHIMLFPQLTDWGFIMQGEASCSMLSHKLVCIGGGDSTHKGQDVLLAFPRKAEQTVGKGLRPVDTH